MLYISGMNNRIYMQVFDGTYTDDRGWQHYRVRIRLMTLDFTLTTLEWECSCPAYKV